MIVSMRGKRNGEGAAADAWLSWVGNEEYLQLGMLADASDEGTRLVRQLDCDDLDEGEVVWDCERYIMILKALFVDGQCLVAPGYTFYAIEALKKVRVNITSGTPKTFGGTLEPEVITRALRRMAAWVIMATRTIDAEFPGFELRSNFKVFALGRSNELNINSNNIAKDAITRLAMAFHVDPDAALKEYYDLLPVAIRAKTNTGQHISNFDAWAEAMKLVSRRRSLKEVHPTRNIGPILMRYCAWASSTSEVERGFAVTSALKAGASEDLHCSRERDILTIVTECQDPSEHDDLICEASKIWREHFGQARAGCGAKARIDTGRSRRSGEYGTGEAAFIRLRRDAALTVAKASVETLGAVDIDSLELTDAQHAEINFQHKNALKRKVMSFQAGHVAAEEVDLELEEAHADYVNKARENRRDRMAANKRKLRHVLKTPIDIERLSWWPGDSALDCAAIASELGSRSMVLAPSRMDAQIFVCVNPAEASIKTRFVARMKGMAICDMAYIRSKGTSGVCLAYKPASMTRRLVAMTDEFLRLHPILANCILGVIDAGCEWKLREVTDILAMLHRPGTAKQLAARQRGVLLFAADSDMDNDELSLIANKITVTTCFASELFSNYDVAKCMAGYCGM